MLDLKDIEKKLIISESEFEEWVNSYFSKEINVLLGFDAETNGEPFPKTELAGFSFYDCLNKKSCYIPIKHMQIEKKYCVSLESIRQIVQRLFDGCTLVTHGGAYDYLLFNKLGFKFYSAIDSYVIAVMLQFQNLGLKELVLEFGLAKFQEVLTFTRLMSKLGFEEGVYDFTLVDIYNSTEALEYATKDPIFSYHLSEVLYEKYVDEIGDTAYYNLEAQFNTMLLFCESTARGYYINTEYLDSFINQYGKELKDFENKLMSEVRLKMGWKNESI